MYKELGIPGWPLHAGVWFHQGKRWGADKEQCFGGCVCDSRPQRYPKVPLFRAQRTQENVVLSLTKAEEWWWWSLARDERQQAVVASGWRGRRVQRGAQDKASGSQGVGCCATGVSWRKQQSSMNFSRSIKAKYLLVINWIERVISITWVLVTGLDGGPQHWGCRPGPEAPPFNRSFFRFENRQNLAVKPEAAGISLPLFLRFYVKRLNLWRSLCWGILTIWTLVHRVGSIKPLWRILANLEPLGGRDTKANQHPFNLLVIEILRYKKLYIYFGFPIGSNSGSLF